LRIGCFLAGCCFGDVVGHTVALDSIADPRLRLQVQTLPALSPESLAWAVRFPAHSLAFEQQVALGLVAADAGTSLSVHPVQLYESAATLMLGLALLRVRPSTLRPGLMALAAFLSYAALAFALQFLRADSALLIGPLNLAQLLYLAWLAAGVAGAVVFAQRVNAPAVA
jgi:prolipoprotein diacylglyceryltransferase